MTKNSHLWSIVMAGGAGTRFWPESREKNPKQFLTLFGKTTLFQETLRRSSKLTPKSRVVVVTQKKYAARAAQLSGISRNHILGEPIGRNTAPCVAVAAQMILKEDPQAVVAILPSDHQIGKPDVYLRVLSAAAEAANSSGLPVTFGIQPDFPHTGYGYLEKGASYAKVGGKEIFRLKQFHEKPDFKKAKKFLASGNFLWNSGMFVWRADRLVEAVKEYLPEVYSISLKITRSKNRARAFENEYPKMPNISIDYGLMEKMKGKILTLAVDMKWCDLGGWTALKDVWPADCDGNIVRGSVLAVESRGNIIKADKRLIAVLGVENLVVVDTGDAVLICPKEKSEAIRKVVAALKEKKLTGYL